MKDNNSSENNQQNNYWLSLDEKRGEIEESGEFQSSPLKDEGPESETDRRDFMKLMGAASALATTGCIRRPIQKLVPYKERPPEVTLGKVNLYASSYTNQGDGGAVVVRTREGRPIHVEANKFSPMKTGETSFFTHAHIMELYDPDRLKSAQRLMQNAKRTNFEPTNFDVYKYNEDDESYPNLAKLAGAIGQGHVAILSSSLSSPSSSSRFLRVSSSGACSPSASTKRCLRPCPVGVLHPRLRR